MCPGVPCVDKKTSGSEVLQDTFFLIPAQDVDFQKSPLSAFGLQSFFERQVFFFGGERDFRGFGKPNMSPKNRAFWKKGNDYLPTTILHRTCLLFREVSLCFPFLKPLIHQAVKHFQTCWVSLSTSRRPAFHVVNA